MYVHFANRMAGLHSWQHRLRDMMILWECSLRLRHKSTHRMRYVPRLLQTKKACTIHLGVPSLTEWFNTCFHCQPEWPHGHSEHTITKWSWHQHHINGNTCMYIWEPYSSGLTVLLYAYSKKMKLKCFPLLLNNNYFIGKILDWRSGLVNP